VSGICKFSGDALDISSVCCMFEDLLYLTEWHGDLEKLHGSLIDNYPASLVILITL
jgi:hypothetical protein